MKSINYKMIVSDFDGTLANSRNGVGADVTAAIEDYRALGGIFAVCTGRILPSILPRLRQLGLSGLAVASQGSTIADIATGKIIRQAGLSASEAAEICALLEDEGAGINVYTAEGFLTNIPAEDPHLNLYESITGITASHVDMPLSRYVREKGVNAVKVASLCFAEDRQRLIDALNAKFKGRFEITASAEVLVEISPLGETKGRAIEFLSQYYGIPLSRIVAVGDNLNDLSMIETAGMGVAVGNAVQELKDSADFVTVTNDEGAVKSVIERFGYSHE